jgi:hypothetical protein
MFNQPQITETIMHARKLIDTICRHLLHNFPHFMISLFLKGSLAQMPHKIQDTEKAQVHLMSLKYV